MNSKNDTNRKKNTQIKMCYLLVDTQLKKLWYLK